MSDFLDNVTLAGSGGNADVKAEAVLVRQVTPFQAAVERGDAYCFACVTANWDANDTILLIENNETARRMYVERIDVVSDTATQAVVFACSGITPASATGNAVTGVNLNRSSGRRAVATSFDDETGQNMQGAAYNQGVYYTANILANTPYHIPVDGGIAVAPDHCIGIDLTAETAAGNATIWVWFDE